ncbi:single-stranded-DNA-specific exonuclease RecJ [Candidatus Enterovibrio escicola]|uniref:single-stranded-DNA-specific exonuclease RecJ n=1 Tax=Candidatus Enterovibrio escicola TaxID=1927127 RepID=UPI001237CC62|nr:single-stranded-DNA-specific exonuclease RecJ [Candidatus Enterovibrio escacola]
MNKIKRRQPTPHSVFPDSIPLLLQRIYSNRGVTNVGELELGAKGLHSYKTLHGIERAVSLIALAITEDRRIIIVGDFDADGATSSALSVRALHMMGYHNVDYLVPNRFEDGYGLSPKLVEKAAIKGAELIMTVDNGVSAIEGVAAAKARGIKVVVTDHHLPGYVLPDVDAIVNPNLSECRFPSKSLAGVGVAFYLMLALRAYLRDIDWFSNKGFIEPNLAELLDLVALGTVADVVVLDTNNRILVHQGLMRIRAGKCRPGIQALIEVANRNMTTLVASDFGFSLGPRLNAAGRLDDMSFGVELLLSEDLSVARQMASKLDALNQTRKIIEQIMIGEAMAICERLQWGEQSHLPSALALYQREWHQGVIGIVASRIKDKFHRPVIVFTDDEKGMIKGSARSVSGLHIRDTLNLIDTQHPGLIKKFGGHAMAAGLTLDKVDFEYFSRLLDEAVQNVITEDELKGIYLTDGELLPTEISLDIAEVLRARDPWGKGFPEPLFDGKFKIIHQKLVGRKHLKMRLKPLMGRQIVDGIAFNVDSHSWPNPSAQLVELVYRLGVNEFCGNRNVQLMVEHMSVI